MRFSRTPVGLGVLLVFVIGCGETVDPRVQALRDKLLLQAVPDGVMSVSSVRSQLQEDDGPESTAVVIRGRINAGDVPPWEENKAAFALTDATGHDGDDDHDPHTCPFCSRSIEDYIAKVSFRDESGQVIDVDSRKLFDVVEKQRVTITGTARLGSDGLLEVDADAAYVER